MSYGLPVIATDVGGVSELIINGETGYLVPSKDIDGLFKYSKILIEDLNKAKKMGQLSRDFIFQNFSTEKMAKEFDELFSSINTKGNI